MVYEASVYRATCPLSPLPLTPWNDNAYNSFSPNDVRFLVDTLSHLIDTESVPSSPESSSSSLLPQTKQEQKESIITSPKVKKSLSGKPRRLCKLPGCGKVDRGHGLCGGHGGGKRCKLCTKAARKSGLCTRHFRLAVL